MCCGIISENRARQKCPARDASRGKCNKIGHFAKVCLSTPRRAGVIAAVDPEEQDETMEDNDNTSKYMKWECTKMKTGAERQFRGRSRVV